MVLDDRERQFEIQFAQSKERAFLRRARRDHLFGLWAAARMGLSGDAAARYAADLVAMHVGHSEDTLVLGKTAGDLAAAGVPIPPAALTAELARCNRVAAAGEEGAA